MYAPALAAGTRARWSSVAASALAVAGLSAVGLSLVYADRAGWSGGAVADPAAGLTAATWLLTGLATAVVRPRLPFGWLLLGGGVCLAAAGLLAAGGEYAITAGHPMLGAWLAWGRWILFPHLAANVLIYLLFPTGTLLSPRWRAWVVLTLTANLALILAQLLDPNVSSDPAMSIANPGPHASWAPALLPFAVAATDAAFLSGLAALAIRWRRGGPDRRIVRVVFAFAILDTAGGLLLIHPPGQWVYALAVPATAGLTMSIAFGLIRHRLWGVRETVGRAVTYGLLTAGVVAVFTLAITLAGRSAVPAAALLVCLMVSPLQRRLQAAVDRFVYGQRHEPYAVLSRLGTALETAGDPEAALIQLVTTAATALRSPWMAIELSGRVVAEYGVPQPDRAVRLPLRHQGADLGELVVGLRRGEAGFGVADRRLLKDLTRQAGAAAHAVSLTAALQLAREHTVTVREEERRRLRRDLHDGVAAALTAVGLTLDVAESAADAPRAHRLIHKARTDVAAALGEVRRVIDDLGPAVLAEAGLGPALDQLARQFGTATMIVTASLRPAGARLPAAIEAAAYRIAAEALQNAAKHAAAARCTVTAAVDADTLRLVVTDDGRGFDADAPRGLGLRNMAERAEEIGGRCTVTANPSGGTLVSALLPISGGER
ncbi:ATP-binding protein [Nocardia sp. CDC153]|uniref:sensor histidine kinase n=1 Tax=Nocardia sp. CDC153 TaxID=3112167 RepID=UPI002DB83834|nr:ATP-binding protein [Nocardia sp. CDC153]MEC3953445.1 ATP-binding protein [Nocardia sp. CDC153]